MDLLPELHQRLPIPLSLCHSLDDGVQALDVFYGGVQRIELGLTRAVDFGSQNEMGEGRWET